MAASTVCWVKAPVAVFTPTPRIMGCESVGPLLPAPGVEPTCPGSRGGGFGSARAVPGGERADTVVLPSAAVRVMVTTYAVPSTRPQPSALSSVKQNLAGARQTAA